MALGNLLSNYCKYRLYRQPCTYFFFVQQLQCCDCDQRAKIFAKRNYQVKSHCSLFEDDRSKERFLLCIEVTQTIRKFGLITVFSRQQHGGVIDVSHLRQWSEDIATIMPSIPLLKLLLYTSSQLLRLSVGYLYQKKFTVVRKSRAKLFLGVEVYRLNHHKTHIDHVHRNYLFNPSLLGVTFLQSFFIMTVI